MMEDHIHPIFDTMLSQQDKESLLQQRGIVVWMTGLSGSGKSTLARSLERGFHGNGIITKLLDGDNLRTGLNKDLGFTAEDRNENIRRVAETAKLFASCGIVTICSFVSPTHDLRKLAAEIIGSDCFLEVYINASFDACAKRDVKGLYAKALRGEIKNFTGLDAPFEPPEKPFMEINTEKMDIMQSSELLFNGLIKKVKN